MSVIPTYVIFQDYSDFQAAHQLPGPAMQGSDLDVEHIRIKATLDALTANLALIQRSDGALNNQLVTPDSISSSLAILIAGWNIKGAWVTATSYVLKDYVTNGGNGYVCIVAHTAGTFATDLAAGKWALVSTAGATGATGATGAAGAAGAAGITRPGFVNRIINGDFGIDQRKESGSATLTAAATVAYNIDRWYAGCSGANITAQRAVGTGQNQFAYQFTGAASNSGLVFGQRIESVNIADLINQTVTVQVWLSSTSITTVTWKTFFANTTDAWGTKTTSGSGTETQIDTGTLTITSTPTLYTFTTNLGSSANKGIDLEFSCAALTATNTLLVQAAQMEFGATANPFERNSIDIRLQRCQRYFQAAGGDSTTEQFAIGGTNGAANGFVQRNLTVPMRAAPTFSVSAVSNFLVSDNNSSAVTTAIALSTASKTVALLAFNGTGSWTAQFRPIFLQANATAAARMYFEAEL